MPITIKLWQRVGFIMGDGDRNILLGNGFNLALLPPEDIKLGYENILNECISRVDGQLKTFLEQAKNDNLVDLEQLLQILVSSKNCLPHVQPMYSSLVDHGKESLESDISMLKNTIIDILTDEKFHPAPSKIFIDKSDYVNTCIANLKVTDRIFTTNYDLILYWLINNPDKSGYKLISKFKDGFLPDEKYKIELQEIKSEGFAEAKKHLYGFPSTNNGVNVMFLHGALHILSCMNRAYKIVKASETLRLSEIKQKLQENYSELDNLLVFEGNAYDKLTEIATNSYLIKANDKLSTMTGSMFIYGSNLSESPEQHNDMHIWDRIINSKIDRLFISTSEHGDKLIEVENNLRRVLEPLKHKQDHELSIHCFCHDKANDGHNIWQDENFFDNIENVVANRNKLQT